MKKISLVIGFVALSVSSVVAQKPTVDFNARGIVVLSDADMTASAMVDGKLMKEIGARDLMTAIMLPLTDRSVEIGSTVVSNTATNWTKGMAVSADGRTGFVLESRGQVADSVKMVKAMTDLPSGAKMFVMDLSNAAKPTVRFGVPTGKLPLAIDMLNNQLVIVSSETDKEIQLLEVDATGRPTRVVNTALKMPGVRATDVSWHPGGEFIAVTLEETKAIQLFKARRNVAGKIVVFDIFGKPIVVGIKPTSGQFTPDGNFYIVSDVKDGVAKSELMVVQLNIADAAAESKVVSQATVGVWAEGFAISPDGSMVVTTNANKSYLPWDNAELSRKSSVSLLSLAKDGKLANVAEYDFEGIAPQSVVFDKTGDNIAVAVYEYFDFGKRNGGVEFWKVTKGATPSLSRSAIKVNVARGAHTLKMIP
jgi:DNA-binding beta-propeller fold protein YncE